MKKAWTIIGRVVTTLILIFAVCVMIFTVISVNTVGKDADFSVFRQNPLTIAAKPEKVFVGGREIV